MDLNLFCNRKKENDFTNKFLKELRSVLENNNRKLENKMSDELEEYNLYEKKKVFLDNISRNGNDLVWIMDNNSVCISENGDGGPQFKSEIDLPENPKIGEVYEKIDDRYVYNSELTEEINKILK